jgi:hypothetical protein
LSTFSSGGKEKNDEYSSLDDDDEAESEDLKESKSSEDIMYGGRCSRVSAAFQSLIPPLTFTKQELENAGLQNLPGVSPNDTSKLEWASPTFLASDLSLRSYLTKFAHLVTIFFCSSCSTSFHSIFSFPFPQMLQKLINSPPKPSLTKCITLFLKLANILVNVEGVVENKASLFSSNNRAARTFQSELATGLFCTVRPLLIDRMFAHHKSRTVVANFTNASFGPEIKALLADLRLLALSPFDKVSSRASSILQAILRRFPEATTPTITFMISVLNRSAKLENVAHIQPTSDLSSTTSSSKNQAGWVQPLLGALSFLSPMKYSVRVFSD